MSIRKRRVEDIMVDENWGEKNPRPYDVWWCSQCEETFYYKDRVEKRCKGDIVGIVLYLCPTDGCGSEDTFNYKAMLQKKSNPQDHPYSIWRCTGCNSVRKKKHMHPVNAYGNIVLVCSICASSKIVYEFDHPEEIERLK